MILSVLKMPSLRKVRNLSSYQKALQTILPETGLPHQAPGEIQFVLVTVPRMVKLNYLHLKHEGPTDVITYDLRPTPDEPIPLLPQELLGIPTLAEIYICPEVARRQAPQFQEPPSRELFRYAVHGLLHLAGLDDHTPEDRAAMRAGEDRLLHAAEAAGFSLLDFLA